MLLPGLLPMACSICFLMQPRTISLGGAGGHNPHWNGHPPQSITKKIPQGHNLFFVNFTACTQIPLICPPLHFCHLSLQLFPIRKKKSLCGGCSVARKQMGTLALLPCSCGYLLTCPLSAACSSLNVYLFHESSQAVKCTPHTKLLRPHHSDQLLGPSRQ